MRRPITNAPTAVCALLFFFCSLLVACTSVQLIPPYDSNIDKNVTALQSDTETFLVKVVRLEKLEPGTYKDYADFYDKEKVAVSGLQVRVEAVSQNTLTSGQVNTLSETYAALEKRHKEKGLNVEDAYEYEKAFNRIFEAILTLEVAKKGVPATTGSSK